MKKWLENFIHSFPIQLLLLHLRSHHLLLFMWIIISLILTGSIASRFGGKFLFLDPEYMGSVNFFSFFILGFAFGGFFMTWNLTTYLLNAHFFPFLATLSRPFTKFCLNNFIIPLAFMILYLTYVIQFQRYYEYWDISIVIIRVIGFLLGFVILLILSAIYLNYTNKDILNFNNQKDEKPPNQSAYLMPGRRTPNIDSIKEKTSPFKVNTYLTENLKVRLVRSVAHYDSTLILKVFKQNHINALIIQLFSLVLLITFGYLIDIPYFIIPAGASVFILASILVSISGAVTYWFAEWKATVFIVVLLGINILTSYDFFNHKNKAYGLNYESNMAPYNYECLGDICEASFDEDRHDMIDILDNWHDKSGEKKPKMVIVCVSGGGLKAAVWAMQVLQEGDKKTEGRLLDNTVLMSGASGGIIGTAYLRELYLQKQLGQNIDIYDDKYIDDVSKDLLNSIAFTIVSNDLFLPWVKFKVDDYTYRKDRGYIFEQQLNKNTHYMLDKRLSDYKQAEKEALIPMMFITPSIVNDGRRLIISSQGVSFMSVPPIGYTNPEAVEIDGVDFRKLFSEQDADNLRFTSALRMNATYPYVLPNVFLPSEPSIEVMDAGFRDNSGIKSGLRYMQVFQDWIKENTSGVVMVQIIGRDKVNKKIDASDSKGIIETIFNPLGIAGQILSLQDYEHDTNLGFMYDLLGKENFDIVRFTYRPTKDNEEASMTFHLSAREKNDILEAINLPENQQSLQQLEKLLQPTKKRGEKGRKTLGQRR